MGIIGNLITSVAEKAVLDSTANVLMAAGSVVVETIDKVSEFKEKHPSTRRNKNIIAIPVSSEHLIGTNYLETEKILKAYGFTDISLLPKSDLISGFIKKEGSIAEISISNRSSFRAGTNFRSDDKIVIVYHTF